MVRDLHCERQTAADFQNPNHAGVDGADVGEEFRRLVFQLKLGRPRNRPIGGCVAKFDAADRHRPRVEHELSLADSQALESAVPELLHAMQEPALIRAQLTSGFRRLVTQSVVSTASVPVARTGSAAVSGWLEAFAAIRASMRFNSRPSVHLQYSRTAGSSSYLV